MTWYPSGNGDAETHGGNERNRYAAGQNKGIELALDKIGGSCYNVRVVRKGFQP